MSIHHENAQRELENRALEVELAELRRREGILKEIAAEGELPPPDKD